MKRRCRLAASCILAGGLIVSGANAAQGAPAAPRKVAAVEGITEYQLDNGLRVLLFPDPSQTKVTVNMTALVGSRQEGYGETGMAHLLEHMLFKGTPSHPLIPKELQEHGATFNGSTTSDRVNYYETLADSGTNLEFAIALEADRMVNSTIKKEDLDSEMTVVRNEFERGENSPQGVLMERIQEVAYDWHNYGKPTIGNRTDIERVPVENLRAFYRKYYQPDNIVLVVAGKFEESKGSGTGAEVLRADPAPGAQAGHDLDGGTAAGRGAVGDAAAGRRTGRGGGGLSCSGRAARGFGGAGGAGQHSEQPAFRPVVQGAGGNQEGLQRLRFRAGGT